MIGLMHAIDDMIEPLRSLARTVGAPLYDLAARLYVANIFWASGMTRWNDFENGTFQNQIFLFEQEHPVPGLSPEIAAHSALAGELIFPVMLAVGLFARLGAAGILVMTAIIEFTYLHSNDHILWAFLAGTIFIKGPGKLSLDYLIMKALNRDQ